MQGSARQDQAELQFALGSNDRRRLNTRSVFDEGELTLR
jgi:hypothetical protein